MKKKVIIFIIGVVVWGAGSSQAGPFDIFPISIASGDQTNPAISGDTVVWQDFRNGNWDIYSYNLATQSESSIISTSAVQTDPDVSGDLVVWTDNRWGDNIIYGSNISTQVEFMISPGSQNVPETQQVTPSVDGDIVVWNDKRNMQSDGKHAWNVYGYNLSTQNEFRVAGTDTRVAQALNPDVSGQTVVWCDLRNPTRDVYFKDLSTGVESLIGINAGAQQANVISSISGNLVVWEDISDGNWNLYGYDLSTQTKFSVSTNSASQLLPAIDGDFIVWQDDRNGDYDIFGYDLLTQTEFAIATGIGDQLRPSISGNIVVWEDGGDIYGAEIVPEPCSLILIGSGFLFLRRKRK